MNALRNTESPLTLQATDLKSVYSDYLVFLGASKKSDRTIDTYRKAMKSFFVFLSSRDVTLPTEGDVLEYMTLLNEQKKTASTMSLYLSTIKTFFRFLSKRRLYENIAEDIETPETDRDGLSKGYLSEDQETSLLSVAMDSPRDYSLLFLMLTTGLRTTEVVNANIEDLQETNGEFRLYVLGKGRKSKKDYVKVSDETLRLLRGYIGERTEGPLFLSESNRNTTNRLTTRSVSRIVKTALKKAGIDSPSITAHSLRHTVAVQNLLQGGTLEETRGLLRHRDIRTTERYSHEVERIRNRSEARLSERLQAKMAEKTPLKVA